MSHPQSYEILLVPEFAGRGETDGPGRAIRSAVVSATGDTGASGYPRYAGEGLEADIDPATHTVEALLVDGAELDYGLSVRISERVPGRPGHATDILPGAADRAEAAAAASAAPGDARTAQGHGQAPGAADRTEMPDAESPAEPADGSATGSDTTGPGYSPPTR